MRIIVKSIAITVLLASALGLSANALSAEQCRNDKGQFIKCPAAADTKPQKCRDAKTKKFASCDAPGTEPVPLKAK
jgi:hypothetical protein